MLVKIVLVFLGVMVLVAMVGKALFPATVRQIAARRHKAVACPRCGRYVIGRSGCDCGRKA
ncbi:hypothetical protein [Tabrizicola sp.]|uniref:hypothetical protein n=1 Tax=Tabrizicola sp. TaxID=2005166 RepID=UPI00286A1820|nr:hypothetical protein [Tabrizicola sp.]